MKDFFYLDNGTIRAKILYPVNAKYTGTRFCHSGFITDIWYKGVKFSEYERAQGGNPTTEGSGMCAAYEPFHMEEQPADGRWYLMPGVGPVLAGDPKHAYQGMQVDFWFDDCRAEFETQSPDVDGYSYYEKRQIYLEDEEIVEKVLMRNTGSKKLKGSEYNHNFLSLGGRDISPDYQLKVYCVQPPEGMQAKEMIYKDGVFTYTDYPTRSCFFKTFDTVPVAGKNGGLAWEMKSVETGISCYEKIDFDPVRVQVWNDYYCMCCEVFAPIDLEPGEETSWDRRWGFSV